MTNSVTAIETYRSAQTHRFLAIGEGGIAVGALDDSEPMTSKPDAVKLLWGHGQEPPVPSDLSFCPMLARDP